jgi:choice-of-anchor B domain-containing protein
MANATAFIEITDPLNPVHIGNLYTHTVNSLWRDIKVYQNHAFIVSEAPYHGLQVFDLTQLLTASNLPVTFSETAYYGGFGHSHNVAINEETGFAYAVGTSGFNGGLHIVNIQDPANPVIAGDFAEDGYTHDTQVVIYNGPDTDYVGKEIAFAFNEDNVAIVNVTNKTECVLIAHCEYSNPQYTHQGWLSPDHKLLYMDDELDELYLGNNTRTYIYNVEDLDNPQLLGYFESELPVIDHNLYTLGSSIYQSNYLGGLRILDATNAAQGELSEVAYFDTNPGVDMAEFDGSWSNYAYFPSGNVVVSTFSHFFVVRPSDEILALSSNELPASGRDVLVYPNPSSDDFTLRLTSQGDLDRLTVVDLTGRMVKEIGLPNISGTVNLLLNELAPGSYVLNFPKAPELNQVIIRN